MCIVMYRARMRALGALGEPLERHRRGAVAYMCMLVYRVCIVNVSVTGARHRRMDMYRVCIGCVSVCIVARPPEWPWNAGIPKECERITRILDVFGSNPDERQDTCQIHARYT